MNVVTWFGGKAFICFVCGGAGGTVSVGFLAVGERA